MPYAMPTHMPTHDSQRMDANAYANALPGAYANAYALLCTYVRTDGLTYGLLTLSGSLTYQHAHEKALPFAHPGQPPNGKQRP